MYFSMSTESHGEFGRRIKSVFYTAQSLSLGHFKWITLYKILDLVSRALISKFVKLCCFSCYSPPPILSTATCFPLMTALALSCPFFQLGFVLSPFLCNNFGIFFKILLGNFIFFKSSNKLS